MDHPPTPIERVMRWTGLAWLAEVRTHSARRRRTGWEKARDHWMVLALVLALPAAWTLGWIVLNGETYAVVEGVIVRMPRRTSDQPLDLELQARPEWGIALDDSGRTVAIAAVVVPGSTAPTARGTVLGSFLVEREIVVAGFPFAFRVVETSPGILIQDHASGRVEPLSGKEILGHRHLEVMAGAIERSMDNVADAERARRREIALLEQDKTTTSGESLVGDRSVFESAAIARRHASATVEAIRSETWSGTRSRAAALAGADVRLAPLVANGLVLALVLLFGGFLAIAAAQFGTALGRGVLAARRDRRRRSNLCPRCGHDVRANVLSARCPECGELLF